MTGYLLDADWINNALANQPAATHLLRRLAPSDVHVCRVTVAEVYEGAFSSPNPRARLDLYYEFLRPYRMLTLSEAIAIRFAELRSHLRRRREIISDFDIMLAATALEYDLTVLTFNLRHLRRVPDLRVYQPA